MQNEVTSRGRQIQFLKEETVKSKYSDLMKQKIDSEEGAKEYSKRMYVIEPVFGNITSNKGLDELSLRGKAKVTGQGRLFALVHNISKLWRYGNQESMAV